MNGPLRDETMYLNGVQDMVEQLLQCYQKRQVQSSDQKDSSSIARIKLM